MLSLKEGIMMSDRLGRVIQNFAILVILMIGSNSIAMAACESGEHYIQGTDTCVAGTAVDDPGIWLSSCADPENERAAVQGDINSCQTETPVTDTEQYLPSCPSGGEPIYQGASICHIGLILDVNESTVIGDWRNLSNVGSDAVFDHIEIQGAYGTFTVTDDTIYYLKQTETKEIDTGVIVVIVDGEALSVSVRINALYWKQTVGGNYHTVAIKSDGTLWAWGYNVYGQLGNGTYTSSTTPVQENTYSNQWVSIAAGAYHTVALQSDGTLWAWGYNGYGELGNGTTDIKLSPTQESTGATDWVNIAAGYYHTIAIKSDGTLWAWGRNNYGQLGDGTTDNKLIPTQESTEATDWENISGGIYHTASIKNNGTLWAWGYNGYGQIGDNTTDSKSIPAQESTEATNWESIAAGRYHTVAIKSDGTLWAWGYNYYGQLGDGTTSNRRVPTQERTEATDWKHTVAFYYHTIAIKNDNTLWAWGYNHYGQLGDGTIKNKSIPTKESSSITDWESVSAGGYHTIATRHNGTLWTWGYNNHGQLGNGTTSNKILPTQENTGAANWKSISAGTYHTVAIKSDGTLWAWGYNHYGQLGDGTTLSKQVPTQESTGATDWENASAGHYHTVAIKSDGTLWAWGHNSYGELGDGTTSNRYVATQENSESTNWEYAEAGGYYSAALKSDGTVWSWGYNHDGELGDGTTDNKSVPTQENSISTDWEYIAVGYSHTVALKSDGTLWAWGRNNYGQLGDSTTDNRLVPTQESNASTDWTSITAGSYHTVAIKSDGTLWAWGRNYEGELGDGTTDSKSTPTQEKSESTNWQNVEAGAYHTIATKLDGTLWAWGHNIYGELGDGTMRNRSEPVQESTGSTDWLNIDGGSYHTSAIKNDGTLWSWGFSDYGQIGDDSLAWDPIRPVERR